MNIIEESGKNYAVSLVKDVVLPKIVEHLQSKYPESEITVEELMEVCGSGCVETVEESSSSFVPSAQPSSVRKKSDDELITIQPKEGEGCIYKFQRGKKKYTYCGKPCVDGLNYCKYCKKKRKSVPGNSRKSAKAKPPAAKTEEEESLSVSSYQNLSKHFLHIESNFVLYDDDQTICAIAKELENGDIRSLTDEEKVEAGKYNLVTIKDEEKEKDALESLKGLVGKDTAPVTPKPIPVTEEPLITKKASVPILPVVPEVPSI